MNDQFDKAHLLSHINKLMNVSKKICSTIRFILRLNFTSSFFMAVVIKRQISRANKVIGVISSSRRAINLLFTGAHAHLNVSQ